MSQNQKPNKAETKVNEFLLDLIGQSENELIWHRPWIKQAAHCINWSTGNSYTGVNTFILTLVSQIKGFNSNEWMTYNQGKARNLKLKKGSKAAPVIYYSPIATKETKDLPPEQRKYFRLAKYSNVFNIECFTDLDGVSINPVKPFTDTEHLEPPKVTKENELLLRSKISTYLSNNKIRVTTKQDQAFYSPSLDFINMPDEPLFTTSVGYTATLAHEAVHSTGHDSRLKRGLGEITRHAKKRYSFEELIAEFGASILLDKYELLDTTQLENSAAYIKGWNTYLKSNPDSIMKAVTKAIKAAEFIIEGLTTPKPREVRA